jgi:hypothetical protein
VLLLCWPSQPVSRRARSPKTGPRPEDRPPPVTDLVSRPSSYPCGQAGNDVPPCRLLARACARPCADSNAQNSQLWCQPGCRLPAGNTFTLPECSSPSGVAESWPTGRSAAWTVMVPGVRGAVAAALPRPMYGITCPSRTRLHACSQVLARHRGLMYRITGHYHGLALVAAEVSHRGLGLRLPGALRDQPGLPFLPRTKYYLSMSTAQQSRLASRIWALAGACVRVAFGPLPETSWLDRNAAGPTGTLLVLVAIGLPVTVASLTKHVPMWVIVVCIAAGAIGLALIIKSLQHPRGKPGQVETDQALRVQAARLLGITLIKSKLKRSPVNITEGSGVSVCRSTLEDSPLTISQKNEPGGRRPKKGELDCG